MGKNPPHLEMKNIYKSFGSVTVLENVNLKVQKGEVHGLMGENGAGKSTLMKILLGLHNQDQGEIYIGGQKVNINTTTDAISNGISMIYQELNPVPHMTVSENIFLGREPINPKTGLIDFKKMNKDTQDILDYIQLDIKPDEMVKDLSVAKVQLVEIAKAISFNSKIIIMDEPTSAISDREVDKLFETIGKLKRNGVTIIYISHKMKEIFKICDSITVLRDGKFIGCQSIEELSMEKLITMMVGREINDIFPKRDAKIGDIIFEVKNFTSKGSFNNVTFNVRKGEVVGIAGLMGAGRTEVVESIFGIRPRESGEMYLHGNLIEINHPRDALRNNIVMVPEDRKNYGLILKLSVKENITLSSIDDYLKNGLINKLTENKTIKNIIGKLGIKVSDENQVTSSLSGGNQQKVVLAKCLLTNPDIIIFDEPTRGIDIGAKSEIYKLICEQAEQGKGVIMISSEMPEILGLSDRIIVLHEGEVTGELNNNDANQEKILAMAMGQ